MKGFVLTVAEWSVGDVFEWDGDDPTDYRMIVPDTRLSGHYTTVSLSIVTSDRYKANRTPRMNSKKSIEEMIRKYKSFAYVKRRDDIKRMVQ
jgi:hypothetical protein